MNRPRWTTAGISAALCSIVLASTTLASSGDSVSGYGRVSGPGGATASVSVSARSDAFGGDPSGVIRIDRTGEHTLSGVADVVCLEVDGSHASVTGRLRTPVANPSDPGTFYQYVFVVITDNGAPASGTDTWNTALRWAEPGLVVTSCLGPLGGGSNEVGNFTVVDN